MYVKFFLENLNLGPYLLHTTSICTCGVTKGARWCNIQ